MQILSDLLCQPLLDLLCVGTSRNPGNAKQTKRPIRVVALCVAGAHSYISDRLWFRLCCRLLHIFKAKVQNMLQPFPIHDGPLVSADNRLGFTLRGVFFLGWHGKTLVCLILTHKVCFSLLLLLEHGIRVLFGFPITIRWKRSSIYCTVHDPPASIIIDIWTRLTKTAMRRAYPSRHGRDKM